MAGSKIDLIGRKFRRNRAEAPPPYRGFPDGDVTVEVALDIQGRREVGFRPLRGAGFRFMPEDDFRLCYDEV